MLKFVYDICSSWTGHKWSNYFITRSFFYKILFCESSVAVNHAQLITVSWCFLTKAAFWYEKADAEKQKPCGEKEGS